ncbi:MAG: aminotransferase [Chloroflexi bacterium GWB2_49_20]|nr:MAG: aminotransferase [Chloroflexi bacterium GWB2_49_20]OGN78165.1 MAG: aminotransferase [Chloroflexi bacterium GWC2_49_37]OGN85201.1 MAG: aminotransferase [Chloroflexi bacterium GWD2_49_16]
MPILNRARLKRLIQEEIQRFQQEHPKSNELYLRARQSMQGGVPMLWMIRWPGSFPIFVKNARGAHFEDVDGHSYIDFCLGDTGAMTGHSPVESVEAIRNQVGNGITLMLPMEDAIWVGEELQRRFGLKFWQFTLTATDANRFAIRMARHITGRPKILVFNYCYHGSVDETFITLDEKGLPGPRSGNLGPPINPIETSRVVEFNDIPALEEALIHGDVAAVLAEPVMTNIGIIHPQPGYHDALRKLTRKYGSCLIIDETHTICTSPGGYTGKFGLDPDFLTCGKPLASGIPAGVYGFTQQVADAFWARIQHDESDVGGVGGTLAGNALSIAAIRATLEHVLTQAMYDRCEALADHYEQGILDCISDYELPWIVKRLGFRVEYWFCETAPINGGEANAAVDSDLDRFMHLWALNRGILMTPFHNMALIAADTTEEDIEYHTRIFREAVQTLIAE